ncbi:hypothetical protein PR003_g23436 [Phytophthora rubi]|uniref:Uncharacterized protein n=1 Tax=Phytophthora rubi TaxID=129364 RepID=A0A6A3GID0_9STRA|nr:hypothetical protein PR001_g31455 [Phytophthora rubi]KAE8966265.1 hypothetical protein PR002_g28415 [Phytophthora rubi]KAE9297675.1 hypothetical protein PR003_g23436 [Phytophthora rubi]
MDDAIALASLAWRGSKVGRNVQRGFDACGLFPLSLVKMNARLNTFTRNGAPQHVQLATWLQLKPLVEKEILKLPKTLRKDSSRKLNRVHVGGRLLTHKVLQEIAAGIASSSVSIRKKRTPALPGASITTSIVESVVV